MSKDVNTPPIPAESPWGGEPLVGEGEIFGELAQGRGSSLFLGRFTMAEVLATLEKKGFVKESRKRGFWPLLYSIDSSAHPLQRFQIFVGEKTPEACMVDLKIREARFDPRGRSLPGFPAGPLRTLAFEWLTLQNPRAEFTDKRAALPGQLRPGLGMSKRIMDVLAFLGKRTHQDALLAFPAYYHNAVLFSRYFRFVNPEKEGEVLAIRRTFLRMSIKQLAWIVHLNCLRTEDGAVYEWRAEEQMLPLRPGIADYFGSRAYRDRVREAARTRRFAVDWERYEEKAQED
jgi:hypothetical protein